MDRRGFLQLASGSALCGAIGGVLKADESTPLLRRDSPQVLFPGLPLIIGLSESAPERCHVALVARSEESSPHILAEWSLAPGEQAETLMPSPTGDLSHGRWDIIVLAHGQRSSVWDEVRLGHMRVRELRFGA